MFGIWNGFESRAVGPAANFDPAVKLKQSDRLLPASSAASKSPIAAFSNECRRLADWRSSPKDVLLLGHKAPQSVKGDHQRHLRGVPGNPPVMNSTREDDETKCFPVLTLLQWREEGKAE